MQTERDIEIMPKQVVHGETSKSLHVHTSYPEVSTG